MDKLIIEVPPEVAQALRVPPEAAEQALRTELALALYARQMLPLGQARRLAGLTRRAFEDLLGERRLPRAYTEEDLEADIAYGLDRGPA